MAVYIHQLSDWPRFQWRQDELSALLGHVRHRQGRLLGRVETYGFKLKEEASLNTLTLDVLKSSEIEGEVLEAQQVRSSIARRLGIDIGGLIPPDRHVEGIVEMMLNATQEYQEVLSAERLFRWHSALFPAPRSGNQKIVVGAWRDNEKDDPMQVVSGASGKERVHFEAPDADRLQEEMYKFIHWFNERSEFDPVITAAIAHLWFVTVHPFDDGNGRIARALADMKLAHADGTSYRFYSMSAQIRKDRNDYYEILESTQKGSLDITEWITWFLQCLDRAISATDETLGVVVLKAKFWDTHSQTSLNNRQRLMLNKLLEAFEGKLTTLKWAKIAKTSQDTALRDVQDLVDKNILIKDSSGGRSTAYVLVS